MCLTGPSRGGTVTKRGEIVEFGDECAFYSLLRGVLSPNELEQLSNTDRTHLMKHYLLFYIKPQLSGCGCGGGVVVRHSFSTSNHNFCPCLRCSHRLFVIPFLHQTTTGCGCIFDWVRCSSFLFYIKPQQSLNFVVKCGCCSSFLFYIKPQPDV